ncbi:MAG: NADH:ubiquinone reductase (Na(+)-transporting) subunit D [Deltaproteobacteria bacterium]|nr:NADH:ubiquinone reductase (Na(+)-transporting) subunit D [Deltaproteobacteria bacterium]MBW1814089.1 NADH:ubiquinone reductase (Na(+)-transporting) subunit D [Deltaproteobacteria bacterium]MBW1847944.1 NADH:ubiquinone reductase (Na(+)-transporting) subunit D [Deltaproteobacteria bacterium]MBW1983197.1 NADH:ubiquinone reductase (Na(+)-transporting) subunit D [Deltaproteobacteria bacterium]MBW2365690.1 NADH:ubiquinone reductase (Na(+)-transporting) subunit D [Deltaproteobacteria bacterium]
MKLIKTKAFKTFKNSVWENNPVSIQSLGICSALAVTVQLKTAVVMGMSMTVVIAFSSMIISLIRNIVPRNIRIIVEISIIATLVILTDEFLRAFYYDISKQLSIFVGLIITNCIVLGRAEAFALSNPPHLAFIDGIGNGAGYGIVLAMVAFIRELFGSGKLFGIKIFPEFIYNAGYEDMGFMLLAPSAFIIIGLMVWLQKILIKENNK